jgi:hypothetical protein
MEDEGGEERGFIGSEPKVYGKQLSRHSADTMHEAQIFQRMAAEDDI